MSKEVIIAGAVALVLTLATAAAFLIPKKPAEPVHSETEEVASNTPPTPTDSDTHTDGAATAAGATSSSTAFTGVGTAGAGDSGSSSSPAVSPGGLAPAPLAGNGPTGSGTGIGPVGFTGTTAGGLGPAPHPFPAPEPIGRPQPAPEQAPPSAPDDGAAREHVVESGETLADISEKYYNTTRYWKKIVAANPGIDPNMLKVGEKLVIPAISHAPPASHGEGGGAPVEGGYTVQAGDSYYRIAQKELGNASRWKEIEKLNPDIEPSELHVGQVIKLPSKQGGPDDAGPDSGHGSGADGGGSDHVHVVAQGETLGEISKQYYGTSSHWRDIVKANPGVDPEALRPGTRLTMPEVAGAGGGHAGAAPAAEEQGPGGTYVVQKGDSLKSIAAKHLGSAKAWKQIVDANPGIDPTRLRIGQKLKLPGKGGDEPSPSSFTPAPAPAFPPAATSGGFSAGAGTGSGATFTAPGGTTGAGAAPSPSPSAFTPAPAAPAPHSP
jgi:nucleoid-associated protein YgaU